MNLTGIHEKDGGIQEKDVETNNDEDDEVNYSQNFNNRPSRSSSKQRYNNQPYEIPTMKEETAEIEERVKIITEVKKKVEITVKTGRETRAEITVATNRQTERWPIL